MKASLPCGHIFDDATSMEPGQPCLHEGGPAPVAGSVSVCFECAAIGVFTGVDLEVRLPTEAERAVILGDPEVVDFVGSLLAYRAEHGSTPTPDQPKDRP